MTQSAAISAPRNSFAQAFREFDWSRTAVGASANWPQPLKMLSSLMLASDQPIFIAWGKQHSLLHNHAYQRLLGPGRTDALGQGYFDAWPESTEQRALFERVYQGEAVHVDDAMLMLPGQHGAAPAYFAFSYMPVREESGPVLGLFCTCRETTEAVQAIERATAQLLSRETLIRTFYQHSCECHAVLAETDDGRFRYEEINPATLRLYGVTREQVIGRTLEEVLDGASAAELNQHLKNCLRLDTPYHYERVQGTGVVEAVATPVPQENGRGRRLVVSARDVTERRRLEQQLRQSQKMEAVGQLTGGLAHDFNNLLAAIMGSLEVLQVRLTQGRVNDLERYVNAAQGAARRSAALTHRLLAFARRQTLDPKPTDVNRLVSDLEELIRRTVGPEIKLEVVGAAGLWPALVDSNQLESALLNLCINGRDAMPDGGKLTIETCNRWLDERAARERELAPGQYLSLCVSDTGTGMTAEVSARAFDPFFTTKPIGHGTGLGLSMVYGFARQSGGQARIYSELGRGSMVSIYLPRHHGEVEDSEAASEAADGVRSEQGEMVLVVDDEATLRMLMAEALRELGYGAIEAVDGVAGLKVLQSHRHIDLLVTDVGLPGGINGRQLADAGRSLRPGLKVLFVTGYAENAVVGHGHLDPGFHVLTKPFPMEALASRVRSILAHG